MNDMRRLINLIETLSETTDDDLANRMRDRESFNPQFSRTKTGDVAAPTPGVRYMWYGIGASVMFMDAGVVGSAIRAGIGGVAGGIVGAMFDTAANTIHYNAIQKERKQLAKQMANTPISTEIRSNLQTFMNNMLDDIPDSKSTEAISDLLKDYLEKHNDKFDYLAMINNMKPIQLSAIAFILYGDDIENAFVKKLQSKLSDKGTQ